MIVLETLLPALAGLLFLCYVGFAPAGWLLPAALGGLRWAALPWTGYAAFTVLAQFATQAGLNMTSTALLALALATPANLLLYTRGRRAGHRPHREWTRAGYAVAAVTALVLLLGIGPLWLYGYHTIIGENWDGEIYLALGEYLRTYAQPLLSTAPPNPLLHTLLVPPYSGRTHGFSYFQAALGAVTGLSSLVTLGPALALLHALAVPAVYFFLRTTWDWAARPALLAATVAGLNPFLLWITYNTFGMQVPSFGLLPLSVAATLLSLRLASGGALPSPAPATGVTPARGFLPVRAATFAALVTAALAVSYHPALTAWAAISGVAGLALLWSAPRRAPLIGTAGFLIAAMLLLSAVAQWLGLTGFLRQYAEQTGGLGLTAFTAPTDALGLSLSFRSLLEAGPGQALLGAAARAYTFIVPLAGILCLLAAALWVVGSARRVPLTWAPLAGGMIYLLLFLRPLNYVYGWFKAQSFVAFLLIGATVGGALFLRQRLQSRHRIIEGLMIVPAGTLLLTLGLLLWQYHWPLRYSPEMMQASALQAYVRPGDNVWVSNSRLMPGQLFNGVLSYFLRDSRPFGTFRTANSEWNIARPDGVYTWEILPARENPAPSGYGTADRAWSNSLLTLYRAPSELLFVQSWDRKGDYPPLNKQPATLWQVGPREIRQGTQAVPAGTAIHEPRELEIGVASFTAATAVISTTGASGAPSPRTVPLRAGVQRILVPTEAGGSVALSTSAAAGVALRWVALRASSPAQPLVEAPLTDVLMLQIESTRSGDAVTTTLRRVDTRLPQRQADRVVVDVYGEGQAHLGYWTFLLTAPESTVSVPMAGGPGIGGQGAQVAPDSSRWGGAAGGTFRASLTFYHGSTPLDTVTDIYAFHLQPRPGLGPSVDSVNIRRLPLLFY